MKIIPLTQGYVTLVDNDIYELFCGFRWHVHRWRNYLYAARNIFNREKYVLSKMHREIFQLSPNEGIVDHINKNTLDNRRENLRVTTKSMNAYNRKFQSNNTSGYRGVHWVTRDKIWRTHINVTCRRIWCGNFNNLIQAAKAYDIVATKYLGDSAILNFPGGSNNELPVL